MKNLDPSYEGKSLEDTANQIKKTAVVDYRHDHPESMLSKIIKFVLRMLRWKNKLERDMRSGMIDQRPAPLPKSLILDYRINESQVKSRMVWQIQPKENAAPQRILYLHGGAYVYNITQIHWQFIDALIKKTRATIIVPDYPLAPLANCHEVFSFMQAIYTQEFYEKRGRDFILMGDSAGAGLALGFAQHLRNHAMLLPEKIILISPWLDITMRHEGLDAIADQDFMLDRKGLRIAGKSYAGTTDAGDFKTSPLYGDLHGLPRISVFTGTHDLLVCDSRELRNRMQTAGLPLNYYEYPKMFHDWVLITHLREAQQAIDQIADLITKD